MENVDDAVSCVLCKTDLEDEVTHVGSDYEGTPTTPAYAAVESTQISAPPPAPPVAPPPVQERVLAGRYEMVGTLGHGGMGVVYHVKDLQLGEEVAIKILHHYLTEDPDQLERFKREILTARRISHENVIRIHDFGMWHDELFVSMELLPTGTLMDLLKKGRLSVRDGLHICIQVANGLGAAHRAGVVHRDVKPQNVLFDSKGTVKIADFGIARASDSTTQTVGFIGTPNYMSPEQTYNGAITPSTDVYAFGVLMFHVFTGQLPFTGKSLLELANQHANDPAPSPAAIEPRVPPELEAVILRCLAKDPEARYANASQVRDDLAAVQTAKPLVHAKVRDEDTGSTLRRTDVVLKEPGAASTLRWVLVAAGLILLAVGTIWLVNTLQNKTAVVQATPTPLPPATTVATTVATPTSTPKVVIATRPTTTPVVKRAVGTVSVTARPWVSVYKGNKQLTKSTPLLDYRLPAGKHKLTFVNDHAGLRVERVIEVKQGQITKIHVDVKTKSVRISSH